MNNSKLTKLTKQSNTL